LSWIRAYQALGDAGVVCRRFGISRPTLRKWLRRYGAAGEAGLCARSRRPHHSPALKTDKLLEAHILDLRRERRLGVKRIRNELQRLHQTRLSVATIHKVLVRHDLSVLPKRQRVRHKPKRYSRPVAGDRVQMDICKIRTGLYQFTAIDDCSRFVAPGWRAAARPRRPWRFWTGCWRQCRLPSSASGPIAARNSLLNGCSGG
jgi:transposase InsO family protein